MRLTNRQRQFLQGLWELYGERHQPVPYALVGARLETSSFTAYDMLKVLEAKGVVVSVYGTPKARTGPGRAPVLFMPLVEASGPDEDWGQLRHRLLQRVRSLLPGQRHTALLELVRELERTTSPLAYCAQVVTALMLLVKGGSRGRGRELEAGTFLAGAEPRLEVGAFTAFMAGLALSRSRAGQVLPRFKDHVGRYESFLRSLGPEQVEALRSYIQEAVAVLGPRRLREQP